MEYNYIYHSRERLRDMVSVKLFGYGEYKKVKITLLKSCNVKGIEKPSQDIFASNSNDSKLENNIIRAKSKIFELAFCNLWQYFFTGTLDAAKYDRTDLAKFHKDLTQFIRNYNRRFQVNIKFLFIPELHSDGKSWHLHGFIMGLPIEHLKQFQVGDIMGKAIAEKVKNGETVFNWLAYAKKFGFCDLEPIRNGEAVSKYVTKYINKELGNCVTALGAHLYYHSKGLAVARRVALGDASAVADVFSWEHADYSNDYVAVYWFDLAGKEVLLDMILEALHGQDNELFSKKLHNFAE